MYEGEIASLTLQSNYAFGVNGVPNLFISPNSTIICEIEILKLRQSVNRIYQSVGFNESIKDELMEKIHSGESVVSSEVMANKKINATKTADERTYYDPVKHQLDPNQIVKGRSKGGGSSQGGYIWEETPRTMDIEIPLPTDRIYTKNDLSISIDTNNIHIKINDGDILLSGPLGGKVTPSECAWAILESDYMSEFIGKQRITVSLEKKFCSQDIWATVISRDYLGEIINFDEEDEEGMEEIEEIIAIDILQ